MKTKNLKTIISFAIVLSLCLALPIMSYAGELESRTYSGSYTNNWSKNESKSYSGSGSPFEVNLNYGYNKTLVNEDIATSFNTGFIHRSKIANPGGTHFGPRQSASNYSDLEVQHRGTPVRYFATW